MRQFNWVLLRSLTVALLWASGAALSQQPPSALMLDGLTAADPNTIATLWPYLQSRSASFVDWLLDGSMLVATRFGDSVQIHRLRTPLGMREQVSFAPGGIAGAAARPYVSDAFAYRELLHGGETSQLFLQRLTDHSVATLTDAGHRDGPPLWAHDGRRIAFTSNRRNGVDIDVYVLDTTVPGATPRLIVGGAGNRWRTYDWSLDDKHLLVGRERSGDNGAGIVNPIGGGSEGEPPECELQIAAVDGGELTPVGIAAGNDAKHARAAKAGAATAALTVRDARFATDGRGVLVLTGHGPSADAVHYQQLAYLGLDGHGWRELGSDASHDVELFDRSADGHFIAYTINDGGNSHVMLIDLQRKLDLTVPALPAGIVSGVKFDGSGQRLALNVESVRSPRDVYVLEPQSQTVTRWTQSEVGPLNAESFVVPQVLHFPTWDRLDSQRRELTALMYRPAAAAATPPAVLLLLCGGGGRQCRPGFDPFVQWLVNQLGAVVIAPNVRGSSGLGRELSEAGQGALRDDAVRDVGSLLVWVDLQRDLDRSRVAVLGEGYGAYLALQSLVDYGDRLRGGIAAFPPPLNALANGAAIRRPVLLVQGLNNPLVPAYQVEQLRSRLRVDGADAQYLAAADEGASFTHASTHAAYLSAVANFLAQLFR
ncbi:MAG TPA: prolyl oligopeptidase family serine peptidase [Steroidobacteraceae bacterium]